MSVDSSVDSSSSSSSSTEKAKASWWHAWLHIFVSVVGTPAIASLPLAFAYLNWTFGMLFFFLSTWTSYYSARLLIQMQEPDQHTYSRVADGIMGQGFAARWVRPFQFLVLYQVTIVTSLTLGQSFLALAQLTGSQEIGLSLSCWTVCGGVVVVITSLVPSIGDMWRLSFLGGLCVLAFLVMCLVACAQVATEQAHTVSFMPPESQSTNEFIFGCMNSLGILAFSYGGHSVLPDVQATLEVAMPGQGRKAMLKALNWAYALITPCYLSISVLAYWAFGNQLTGYLPTDLQPYTSVAFQLVLNILLILSMISLGAIYIQAGFNLVEDMLPCLSSKTYLSRFLLLRLPWVAFATFLAVAFPFFGDLAGLSGAIGFTPMTFVFPFLLWERSEEALSASSCKHIMHITAGVGFMFFGVLAFTGALYLVVRDASTYQFFS